MRWEGLVARTGRGEVHTGFVGGNLKERDHLEDPGIDGTRSWVVAWTGLFWLRVGTGGGKL